MLTAFFQMKLELDYLEVAQNAHQRGINILRCIYDHYSPVHADKKNIEIDISEAKNKVFIRYVPGIGSGNKLKMLDYL